MTRDPRTEEHLAAVLIWIIGLSTLLGFGLIVLFALRQTP